MNSTTGLDLTEASALEVIDATLEQARRRGASSAEASLNAGAGLSVRVRKGALETVEHHRDKSLAVVVYDGHRKGSASTTDFSPDAIGATVQAAIDAARFTSEDPWAGLADPAELARGALPDLDLCHPWPLDPQAATGLAHACEAAALAHDARIANSEGAAVNTQHGLQAYGNSHGFRGAYAATRHSMSCSVVAQDAQGMQRDHDYTVARHRDGLAPAAGVGANAAARAVARLSARKLSTRTAPVIFDAALAAGLFGHFVGAIAGAAQYRKASFLLEAAGRQIFPAWLAIREEPLLPRGLNSAPFDMDGLPTRPRTLVADGVLQGYVLDCYAARRLGLPPTGNAGGVHNLLVGHGDQDQAQLLGRMGTGLLVTELIGFGVNGVTGDYSRGAAGFWVERGEIAYPVHEITIAGNLTDMYAGIVAIGADVDRRHGIQCGSVLLESMTIAGA